MRFKIWLFLTGFFVDYSTCPNCKERLWPTIDNASRKAANRDHWKVCEA